MITHDIQQGTPDWHQFRLQHFGASEAAAMLGLSKKVKRDELLRIKSTGISQEFSKWVQKNVLDYGHEVEAKARPIVEAMIGEELYPVTCSDGRLSASCDGLTMMEDVAFEHKQINAALCKSVSQGILPEEYMPQCQQIMMVTGAKKVIFVVSDGTPENFFHMDVLPDQKWFKRLRAGWQQFEKDLEAYTYTEVATEAIGRAPEALPALRIEVSGSVTASNLDEFKARAMQVFGSIKTDLETDEDFADAEKTTKWCKQVEEKLEAAKQHALSQTTTIDELFRAVDEIKEEAKQKRLTLEKLVKNRKDSIRIEKIDDAKKKFAAHVAELQSEINQIRLMVSTPDFGGTIKGLKTISSIQNAIDAALAEGKISADLHAQDVRKKLAWCSENVSEHPTLLADLPHIIAKPIEDFTLLIQTRIDKQKMADSARIEAEQQRMHEQQFAQKKTAPPEINSAAPEKTPEENQKTITLGEMRDRLGISFTTSFLKKIGVITRQDDGYQDSDFHKICTAIMRHIHTVSSQYQQ